ncbi:MAG: DUF5985 family protein [Pirellulales bacterium]
MSSVVYSLCAVTSLACAVLLLRGYRRSGVRLLFWSGLCFVGLALDNMVLIVDQIIIPDVDVSMYRRLPGLVSLSLLLYGLIWESR